MADSSQSEGESMRENKEVKVVERTMTPTERTVFLQMNHKKLFDLLIKSSDDEKANILSWHIFTIVDNFDGWKISTMSVASRIFDCGTLENPNNDFFKKFPRNSYPYGSVVAEKVYINMRNETVPEMQREFNLEGYRMSTAELLTHSRYYSRLTGEEAHYQNSFAKSLMLYIMKRAGYDGFFYGNGQDRIYYEEAEKFKLAEKLYAEYAPAMI